MLFSMQRYNFFESDSQPSISLPYTGGGCLACKDTIFLKAIHNVNWTGCPNSVLFSMQRYNFFESDSQLWGLFVGFLLRCLACKDTIFLKAIHNAKDDEPEGKLLFSMQRYNFFESDSQLRLRLLLRILVV